MNQTERSALTLVLRYRFASRKRSSASLSQKTGERSPLFRPHSTSATTFARGLLYWFHGGVSQFCNSSVSILLTYLRRGQDARTTNDEFAQLGCTLPRWSSLSTENSASSELKEQKWAKTPLNVKAAFLLCINFINREILYQKLLALLFRLNSVESTD